MYLVAVPTPVEHVRQRSSSVSSPRNVAPDPQLFSRQRDAKPPTTGPVKGFRREESRGRGPPSVIMFYEKDQPYYGFTNFSPHPVVYQNKKYPTSEHLFQAMKVISPMSDFRRPISHNSCPGTVPTSPTSTG